MPLRFRLSEGRACRVRCATLDDPFRFIGHDKHAPPNLLSEGRACRVRSEGPACRVRCARLDDPFRFIGHDKHAPPISPLGGTRLSRPMHHRKSDTRVKWSNKLFQRALFC
jgi:hypothetical protein